MAILRANVAALSNQRSLLLFSVGALSHRGHSPNYF